MITSENNKSREITLTYLKPDSPYTTYTSKSYQQSPDRRIRKVNDYSMRKDFDVELDTVTDLGEALRSLRKRGNEGYFRIASEPCHGLDFFTQSVRRKKENFPESSSRFLMLDLDGWVVDEPERWSLYDPESTGETIRRELRGRGFDFLADVSFIFLLTSSQWKTETLNCHLYFILTKPIHLSTLRAWCVALRIVYQQKIFDEATQRAVQPDYVSPRECINFSDPMPESGRVHLVQGESNELDTGVLKKALQRAREDSGWRDGDPDSGQLPEIASTWDKTLRLCGFESRGINDPSHRAAAQLVQHVGRNQVLKHLPKYAKDLRDLAWESILQNDPYSEGVRDLVKDKETYTLTRFQQYLKSACDQKFGDGVDDCKLLVAEAIDGAKSGNVSALFDRPVIRAWNRLRYKHIGAFAEIKIYFKQNLRGTMSWTDYEKALNQNLDNQVIDEENLEGPRDSAYNENQYLERMLDEFDWLTDEHGAHFCGYPSDAGDGSYKVMPIDSKLTAVMFDRGLAMSGGKISDRFGEKVIKKLFGHETLYANSKKSRFVKTPVGVRIYPMGGPYSRETATWINLGPQKDGIHKCMCIDETGIEVTTEKHCPVRWRWTPTMGVQHIPTPKELEFRFPDIEELKAWTITRLFDFFNIDGDYKALLMGTLFAMLSGRGTSPIVELVGPKSCGKSTAGDFILGLVDPVEGGLAKQAGRSGLDTIPKKDFLNVVSERGISFFDNVSQLNRAWQDLLCQVSTGCGKDERVLYSSVYKRIHVKSPLLLGSMESVITRPDLRSRKETIEFFVRPFSMSTNELQNQWREDKPFLFMGLMHLLSTAIERFSLKDTSDDMNGLEARRMWYTIADDLFYDALEIEEVRKARKESDAFTEMVNNDFCLGFVAYLQHKETTKLVFEIEDIVLHIREDYAEFILARVGQMTNIQTISGVARWKVRPAKAIPETPQGFTWQLNKFHHSIEELTGWDINSDTRRSNKGTIRVMRKKGPESLDTLDDLM